MAVSPSFRIISIFQLEPSYRVCSHSGRVRPNKVKVMLQGEMGGEARAGTAVNPGSPTAVWAMLSWNRVLWEDTFGYTAYFPLGKVTLLCGSPWYATKRRKAYLNPRTNLPAPGNTHHGSSIAHPIWHQYFEIIHWHIFGVDDVYKSFIIGMLLWQLPIPTHIWNTQEPRIQSLLVLIFLRFQCRASLGCESGCAS